MQNFLKKYSDVPSGFVKDFFEISKESYNSNEFAINFMTVIKWLKVRKDHLKRLLLKNFEEDYDYTIQKIKIKNKKRNGSNYQDLIYITPDCFKELCMISQTTKAKQVRKYYLSIEKLIKKYHQHIQDKLYKELGLIKKNQKPIVNKKKGVVYILKALNTTTTLYKIGRSDDLKKRLKNYNSGNANDVEPLFILEVNDIEKVENCVKNIVKDFKYRKYKEVYELDIDILKNIMMRCDEFVNGFDVYFQRKNKSLTKKKFDDIKGGGNFMIYISK